LAPADQWRWTDDDGVQRLLAGDELRAAIAEGRLKPSTLVWRRGMKSWLPAASVPELTGGMGMRVAGTRGGPVGRPMDPTPSVPDPGFVPDDIPQPSNMINIAALRAQQSNRPAPRTDLGYAPTAASLEDEDEDPATDVREGQGEIEGPSLKEGPGIYRVVIPQAPKVPSDIGADEPRWPSPSQDGEQTVTRVRSPEEEEDTTLQEASLRESQESRAETKPRPADKGSKAPPSPRGKSGAPPA